MNKCENCNIEHDGSYGSGRFCSKFCARSWVTSADDKLELKSINCCICGELFEANKRSDPSKCYCQKCRAGKKIAKKTNDIKAKKKYKVKIKEKNVSNICKTCKNEFLWYDIKSYCSKECYNEGLSIRRIEAIKSGKTNFNSIKCVFDFNGKKIRCDSKIEYSGLDYFVKNYNVKEIDRCDFSIEYYYNSGKHRFLPDFKIITDTRTYIVECKSFVSSKVHNEKWHFYNETQEFKKAALIEYCKKNNYEPFWFTKNMNGRHYASLKF